MKNRKVFILHELQKIKNPSKYQSPFNTFIWGVFTSEKKAITFWKKHKEAYDAEISEFNINE